MRADFDPEVRAWYLTLSEAPRSTTADVSDEFLDDLAAGGKVVGVEFLLAPAELAEECVRRSSSGSSGVRTALTDLGALAVA